MSAAITLGFSPCPNDCFMFDAMIHGKVDTEGLSFDVVMTDVEDLNKRAFKGKIDVSKLSYHAIAYLLDKYVILNSGSALGKGCGPLLITNETPQISNLKLAVSEAELSQTCSEQSRTVSNLKVAIPGKYTTANLLFSLAFPDAKNKVEMVFSEIEDAILKGKVDAGVIIHENRFTYEQKGLKKIIDLGEYWERTTNAPIPLGGIAVKRSFDKTIRQKIDRVLRKSVEFAFANPSASRDFVKAHAQEMDEEVMQKHINLYVNNYSVDLGEEGRRSIRLLFEKITELGFVKVDVDNLFVS